MLLKVRLPDPVSMIYQKLYIKFVIINSKGESMFYIKIQKALYALLRTVLLFYKMMVNDL